MPDDAQTTAEDKMAEAIESELEQFDDDNSDSDKTDDEEDDSNADSATDSDEDDDDSQEDSEDDSDDDDSEDDDSDDSKDKTDDESDDPDFDFRDTPTNIKNFVAKLERMTPELRQEKIASLDPVRNKAELKAIEGKFSDDTEEAKTFTVSEKEWNNVQEQLKKLENLDGADDAMKLMETLSKKRPELEAELTTRMLKEKYGDRFDEVGEDPKFQAAMKALEKLDLPDRLAQASMHSKVARDILIEKAASKQNSLKALAKKKSSSAKPSHKKKDHKHSVISAEGIEERFGKELAALDD